MEQQEPSVQQAQGNGMAVAGMVCGIVGVVFAVIPCTSWIGIILGIIGLVLGFIAKKSPEGQGMAMTGVVTGIVAVVIGAIWTIAIILGANKAERDMQEGLQQFGRALEQAAQEAQRQQQRQAPNQLPDPNK